MIVSRKISVQAITALLAAFAAVVLLAAVPSPAAAVDWSLPATDLSAGPANDAGSAQVAVGSDGATTVVWTRSNGSSSIVQASTRPAGSVTFGGAVDLSAPGQNAASPKVAVAVDGATTVVWYRSNGVNNIVQASTRPAGSGKLFGGAENLSAAGQDAGPPQVAVAVDGATTVVWYRWSGSSNIVQASTRPAGSGTFGDAENLSVPGQNAFSPQVAVGVDGATTVVWTRSNGVNSIAQASTRPAGSGTFGGAENLSAAGQDASPPQVAVAVDGATTVVWYRSNGVSDIVQASTRPAGAGTFGGAENLSAPGQNAASPKVAVGADGATTVVWTRSNGVKNIVQASTRPAGSGTFGGAENLSTEGQNANYPQVAVAVDGATTVVWYRSNGVNTIVQASTRPAGSVTFGGAENLSAAGQNAASPQVAVAVDGAATVVWQRDGPTYIRIQESTSGATMYSLTLTKSGAGNGSVSSGPAGIDCGLVCSYHFSLSTSVTLTASPAAGSAFAGWSGSGCSGTSTCTVTMLGARAVTAQFTANAPPPKPSNVFPTPTVKVGASALVSSVRVPGPGTVTQIVTRSVKKKSKTVKITVCKTSKKATKAGTVKLTCKLSSATRKARAKGSLRVSMKTTFAPTGGLPASKTQAVTLKRKR